VLGAEPVHELRGAGVLSKRSPVRQLHPESWPVSPTGVSDATRSRPAVVFTGQHAKPTDQSEKYQARMINELAGISKMTYKAQIVGLTHPKYRVASNFGFALYIRAITRQASQAIYRCGGQYAYV